MMTKPFIVYDSETCPIDRALKGVVPSNMLAYNIGWVVVDAQGNFYRLRSFIVDEIFNGCPANMDSAYYARKIPQYLAGIADGTYTVASLYEIRETLLADMAEFGTNIICAHNARFDIGAINATVRTMTETYYTRYLPKTVEVWDSMLMAQDTICKQPTYRKWCEEHDKLTKNNRVRKTAEALYQYIYKNEDFEEEHTALADVIIEAKIVAKCFAQHKPMRKTLYTAEI